MVAFWAGGGPLSSASARLITAMTCARAHPPLTQTLANAKALIDAYTQAAGLSDADFEELRESVERSVEKEAIDVVAVTAALLAQLSEEYRSLCTDDAPLSRATTRGSNDAQLFIDARAWSYVAGMISVMLLRHRGDSAGARQRLASLGIRLRGDIQIARALSSSACEAEYLLARRSHAGEHS